MAGKGNILVGTVGQGVMWSDDFGESWLRIGVNQGMHSDAIVRCLASDPIRPEIVYAGTDMGLYRTENGGARWELLDTAMNGRVVWTMAIDPADPKVMYTGTGTPSRPGIFRSTDGGGKWEELSMEIAGYCANVGIPRLTGIAVDPAEHSSVWVGIEVDGVRRSSDGGDSWRKVNGQLPNPDVHSVLVALGPPKSTYVAVNDEVWVSKDDGATWRPVGVGERFSPLRYPRCVAVSPSDPRTIYLTLGDSTPGTTGGVMRSRDGGERWEELPLPVPPNSAMWVVRVQPDDPSLVLAASRYGYLYRSEDGGDSWSKLKREFSEVSSVAWVPR